MATLTNSSKQLVGVEVAGETVYLSPGVTIPVEASEDWKAHLFVKAKWVQYDPAGDEGEVDEGDDEPTALTVTDITGEDGVFTVRANDGVEFSPAKNQVREDGTMTAGGLKAYEAAKAATGSNE